jgi:hydroxylamine reductase (hybrid-cluster protein)
MYMHKDKEQARRDRKMELEGTLTGVYMRNNQMRELPIDQKTVKEIIDYIVPFYITMSNYDFKVFSDAIKIATKSESLTTEQKKNLRMVLKKFELFNKA